LLGCSEEDALAHVSCQVYFEGSFLFEKIFE
jgi:hypothetical protein